MEIARRTEKNLGFIKAEFDRMGEDSPVHVVTQLVNSLLGMVILPREQYLELLNEETDLGQLVSEGWPEWNVTKGKADTLGQLARHIRNATAHGRLTFSSDSRYLHVMELPHVGMYSAHAVVCFAFGRRVPVVDLSIVRVLSRLAGIEPPSDIRRAPEVWEIARSLLPDKEVKEHNYGLLDFAADTCKASSPRCDECPVAPSCAHAGHWARIGGQDITPGDL